jgi:hypothetical protein
MNTKTTFLSSSTILNIEMPKVLQIEKKYKIEHVKLQQFQEVH